MTEFKPGNRVRRTGGDATPIGSLGTVVRGDSAGQVEVQFDDHDYVLYPFAHNIELAPDLTEGVEMTTEVSELTAPAGTHLWWEAGIDATTPGVENNGYFRRPGWVQVVRYEHSRFYCDISPSTGHGPEKKHWWIWPKSLSFVSPDGKTWVSGYKEPELTLKEEGIDLLKGVQTEPMIAVSRVIEVAMAYAQDHDWCEVVEDALAEMGIELEPKKYRITVEVESRFQITDLNGARAVLRGIAEDGDVEDEIIDNIKSFEEVS